MIYLEKILVRSVVIYINKGIVSGLKIEGGNAKQSAINNTAIIHSNQEEMA